MGSIFLKYGVSFHLYADDTQLYLPFKHNDSSSIYVLLACLKEANLWLTQNFLAENKTEIVLFGPSNFHDLGDLDLGDLSSYVSPCAKNLGVLFDSGLKFNKQINSVVKSCFYSLRRLAKVKPFLSLKNFEIVINSFITSRLDYCLQNLYLQMVQNAAASKFDHISPILISLHWLPVKQRIELHILVLVFKALYGLAPAYLSDLLRCHNPSRALRSGNLGVLAVRRSRLKHRGDRAFVIAGPKLWNSLLGSVRMVSSLSSFIFKLIAHLLSVGS